MSAEANGGGFGTLLTVVFITLKLTHYIDWSWWWVLGPLWIPLAIVATVMLIGGLITALVALVSKLLR